MASDIKTVFESSTKLFAQDPGAARFTVSVGSDLVGATEVVVRTGDKVATVDEPEVLGGASERCGRGRPRGGHRPRPCSWTR